MTRDELATELNQHLMDHGGSYRHIISGSEVKAALMTLYDALMENMAGGGNATGHSAENHKSAAPVDAPPPASSVNLTTRILCGTCHALLWQTGQGWTPCEHYSARPNPDGSLQVDPVTPSASEIRNAALDAAERACVSVPIPDDDNPYAMKAGIRDAIRSLKSPPPEKPATSDIGLTCDRCAVMWAGENILDALRLGWTPRDQVVNWWCPECSKAKKGGSGESGTSKGDLAERDQLRKVATRPIQDGDSSAAESKILRDYLSLQPLATGYLNVETREVILGASGPYSTDWVEFVAIPLNDYRRVKAKAASVSVRTVLAVVPASESVGDRDSLLRVQHKLSEAAQNNLERARAAEAEVARLKAELAAKPQDLK